MQATVVLVLALAAVVSSEAPSSSYGAPFRPSPPQRSQPQPKSPPQPRPQQQQQQPQQQQQQQVAAQARAQPAFAAPLPFSPLSGAGGLPPFGRQFFIPAPEPARLSELYRLPNEYGPPLPTFTTSAPTTTEAATSTTEAPTTTEPAPADFGFAGGRNAALSEALESGVYYVLQPDGRLQRIAYAHGPAPAAATPEKLRTAPGESSALQQPALSPAYLARFQYQELQPAGAPIYSYGKPELVRVN